MCIIVYIITVLVILTYLSLCIHMYICIYIYIYTCIYIYIERERDIYVYVCIYIHYTLYSKVYITFALLFILYVYWTWLVFASAAVESPRSAVALLSERCGFCLFIL